MNYIKIYHSIITNAKNRKHEIGMEKHHIIPDFMFISRSRKGPSGHLPGNPNAKDNIVSLTAREHLLCHLLLAKHHRGTRYEYQSITSVLLMMSGGKSMPVSRQELAKKYDSKLYRDMREHAKSSISKHRKGTMPCRDVESGEIVGSFSIDHPNVKSGKWVHHSKGRKQSEEARLAVAEHVTGSGNPRFSGISNEDFLQEYVLLANKMNRFPPFQFFRTVYFEKFGVEFPKTLSKYRFNCGKDLEKLVTEQTGFIHEKTAKFAHKLNPKDFI